MAFGIFRISNFRRTYYYVKKNGITNTFYAVWERVASGKTDYCYNAPADSVLDSQRKQAEEYPYMFSILVPTYETKEEYLREMIASVLGQSYGKYELILADASKSSRVQEIVREYRDQDSRIRYIRLAENKGISENTNVALAQAKGDYVGLLDHDDVLAPDALFETAKAIYEKKEKEKETWMLYSDEDKGNGELTEFYDLHKKPGLNLDLLFSNNYICHFLVMKKELMQELRLRQEFDGAQDYDLVLRAVEKLIYRENRGRESVVHIPKVLYHWRCHRDSTAENPESKRYAYEAGKRALEDFFDRMGWKGSVSHTLHLGFYHIKYEKDIFAQRKEVGVVGGKLLDRRGRIAGGIYNIRGKCPYRGLNRHFSGYMHRASLNQEAYAVDLRCMRVRKELWGIFEDVFGFPYKEIGQGIRMKRSVHDENGKLIQLCMEFGRRVRKAGYTVVWQPDWNEEYFFEYERMSH